jgi:hypothetical protein
MQDNRMHKELLEQMIATPGWEIAKGFIDDTVARMKTRLLTVDPKDTCKIVEYQTTIKNYEWLLNQIYGKPKKQEE